ncbi:hypothetical protein EIP86_008936 [Pleurotus ostreatoroseus]|nr:hypothetical protein EIP86_008936 [Pleurotus ostreatoroseus]
MRAFAKLASKVGEGLNKDRGKDIKALSAPKFEYSNKGRGSNRVKIPDGRVYFSNIAADYARLVRAQTRVLDLSIPCTATSAGDATFSFATNSADVLTIATAATHDIEQGKAIWHREVDSTAVPAPVLESVAYGGAASLFPSLSNDSDTTTSSIKNYDPSSEGFTASCPSQSTYSNGFLNCGMSGGLGLNESCGADWVDQSFDYTRIREEDLAQQCVDPQTNYPQYYELSVAFPASYPDYILHQVGAKMDTSEYSNNCDEDFDPDEDLGRMPKRRRLNSNTICQTSSSIVPWDGNGGHAFSPMNMRDTENNVNVVDDIDGRSAHVESFFQVLHPR